MMLQWRVRFARDADVEAMLRLQIATWRDEYRAWLGSEFFNISFQREER